MDPADEATEQGEQAALTELVRARPPRPAGEPEDAFDPFTWLGAALLVARRSHGRVEVARTLLQLAGFELWQAQTELPELGAAAARLLESLLQLLPAPLPAHERGLSALQTRRLAARVTRAAEGLQRAHQPVARPHAPPEHGQLAIQLRDRLEICLDDLARLQALQHHAAPEGSSAAEAGAGAARSEEWHTLQLVSLLERLRRLYRAEALLPGPDTPEARREAWQRAIARTPRTGRSSRAQATALLQALCRSSGYRRPGELFAAERRRERRGRTPR